MRARHALLFGLVSSVLLAAGCGAGKPSNTGGGGDGGAAGSAGAAGAAGSAGAGNNGGAAGAAGMGGAGNNGGAAGMGGAGGAGNNGGAAGMGGAGGGCGSGTADCNMNPNDGCETDILSDVNNCGMCGNPCQGGPGAPPSCNVGTCGLMCAQGKGDCNNNVADGCEADLVNDSAHCGTCGITCMGSPCVQGACACAAQTQTANLLQLDLFIMLDKSGSMTESTAGGPTKWEAVTTALKGFFADPANAKLGVGLQYFAIVTGQTCSPTCFNDPNECGNFGPCVFGLCLGCAGGTTESCNVADYAKAAVPIAPLTMAQASALTSSINMITPDTNTPTGPALEGAIQHAKSWKMTHPGHEVVVVLATDGEPTECTPQDIPSIANIAAAGVNGNPSVKSFVIGVGSSLTNLNAIAAGGGTGSAFIVDTGGNVVQQFQMALNSIQKGALGCEYTIPKPQMGMVDYTKINVQYTPGGGTADVIPNVKDKASCVAGMPGWYYDNNAAPTKIVMCDTPCKAIEMDMAAKVEILLGCATEHM